MYAYNRETLFLIFWQHFTVVTPAAACDVIDQHMNKKVLTPPPEEPENDILTPKAPSIAFPLAMPAVAPEPQVKGSKFVLTTTREALIWSK